MKVYKYLTITKADFLSAATSLKLSKGVTKLTGAEAVSEPAVLY